MQEYKKSFRIAGLESGSYGTIVAICSFVLALGLSLAVQRYFHFEFQDTSGIAGWISANKYPKQQEIFYYLSAMIFVPTFTILCWYLWVAYSTVISRLINFPVQKVLKQDAFTYLPFLLIIGKFNQLDLPVGKLFLWPLVLSLVAKIALIFYNLLTPSLFSNRKTPRSLPIDNHITDKCGQPLDESTLHPGTTQKQDMILKHEAVWSISVSCLCIGFYVLLGFINNSTNVWLYITMPSVTVLGTLTISLIYSFIVSRLFKFQFHNVLVYEAYSNIPAVLLLIFAVSYPKGKDLLLVIFLFFYLAIKLLFLLSRTCRELVCKQADGTAANTLKFLFNPGGVPLFKLMMEYLTIPALIYVFFYDGADINQGFDFFSTFKGIDLFHEGEKLAPLNELLRGGIPFRDIYIQHGLFQNALRPLLSSALFGETLAAVRLLERLFVPVGYVAFYLLGLHIFRNRFTAILALFIASGYNFWVIDRHSLGLISIAFMASFITHNRHSEPLQARQGIITSPGRWLKLTGYRSAYGWKLILAGICTTLAFFFSTEIGLYSFATCIFFLLVFGFTQKNIPLKARALLVLYYGTGALIGFLPFAVYFSWHSALDDLILNSYVQCVYQIQVWGLSFPELSEALSGIKSLKDIPGFIFSETFSWYLPVLIYLITGTYLLFQAVQGCFWASKSNAKLLLLFLAGIIFFRTALGRSDIQHLIYGSTFIWFISLFFLERALIKVWYKPSPAKARHSLGNKFRLKMPFPSSNAILISIPLVIFVWYVISFHKPVNATLHRLHRLTQYENIERNVQERLKRAGNIHLPDDQLTQIQQVVKYIQSQTSPDEPFFDFSNQGAYYFFANRPAVTRYHQIAYASTSKAQKEVIQALEKNRTKLVIFKTGRWFDTIDGIPNTDRNPLIARYLDENYEEAVDINGTVILKRKDMQD